MFSLQAFFADLLPSASLILDQRPQTRPHWRLPSIFHGDLVASTVSPRFGLNRTQENDSIRVSFAILSTTVQIFFFVMALFVLIVSFLFTLDLRGNETATTTKILSYCDLKQMAIPNSEDHHCLSGPQVPSRCHCLQLSNTIKSGHSPSLQPTISLSKFQIISSHVFQNFPHCFQEKKKDPWCVFSKIWCTKNILERQVDCLKRLPEDFPSFSSVIVEDWLVQRTITPSTELCTVFQDHITRLPELWLPATIWSVPSPRRAHQEHRSSHTKLTPSIIDLNLKILLFCMRFCPSHTTASV